VEQEQRPPPPSATGSALYLQQLKKDISILKEALDYTEQIENLKHHWRGEFKKDGKWQPIPGANPIMNEAGIAALGSDLHFLNKGQILANLNQDEYNSEVYCAFSAIIEKMLVSQEEWDLEDEDFHTVGQGILNLITNITSQGVGGQQAKRILETIVRSENLIEERPLEQKNRGGIFGFLGGGQK
jgi:hypothetical protein